MLSAFIRLLVIVLLHAGGSLAHADDVVSGPAAELRAKYASLQEQLGHSQFQKPLYLDSSETGNRLQGDLYGVLDESFASARGSLKLASQWCDIRFYGTALASAARARAKRVLGHEATTVPAGKRRMR